MQVGKRVRFTGHIRHLPVSHLARNEERKIAAGGQGVVVDSFTKGRDTLVVVNFDDSVYDSILVSARHLELIEDAA